jgi:DNA-binding IclR family transcriptional regulator
MIDRPFVQGSTTSLLASCQADSATGRARVLSLLKANPFGLTRQEIGEQLGMAGDTVRPRVAELLDRKLIQPSGEIRRTVTGRACEVLEAAQ